MQKIYLLYAWLLIGVMSGRGMSLYAQVDTTRYHELSNVEVTGKQRRTVTREATPLQVIDRTGIERLGVQDQFGSQAYGCQLRWCDLDRCLQRTGGYQPLYPRQCRKCIALDRPSRRHLPNSPDVCLGWCIDHPNGSTDV